MIILIIVAFLLGVWLLFKRRHVQAYGKFNLDGPFALPVLGNILSVLRRPFYQYEAENYKRYGANWIDYIFAPKGCIVTCDPQIAKRILVKDFSSFRDRIQPGILPKYARKALNFAQEDWKRIRAQTSPVFSSSRIRQMYTNFEYPLSNCTRNIDEIIEARQGGNVEVRKLLRGFALDNIANVVFSLKTNAYKDDEFSKRVSEMFAVNLPKAALGVVLSNLPIVKLIVQYFDLSILNPKQVNYFASMTLRLMEERKNTNIVYNDFIELLLKSESDTETIEKNMTDDGYIVRKLSTEEIVGSALIFFVGGVDTVSNAMMHILLELSLHPEVQEKLHAELVECFPNDLVPYEAINKSEYLNAVVDESLRLHVPLNRLVRIAMEDVDLGRFSVIKGQMVGVSIQTIHRNPELFGDDAESFRPERFLNGEVETGAFMPFGAGPRNCIANRFALLEVKSCLIRLIKRFRFSPNENTMKYQYIPAIPVNQIDKNGLRLKIERR